ncbi:aldo/keto reductase [Streptomyces pactum]|uniref:Aldo/keto reductase n=1 Tax=Streptomyces pactum TaxID=68249 RepID=A0ABS0NSU0_9ACTN|nr:aldo/keto reductase [Streptomyces pactum]MBH5338256.1 aldo/keto reductase [Streptomyces pactum]
MTSTMPTITLNNGVRVPQLGFGVFQVPDDETATAVGRALEAGYRSIDTAAAYRNEKGVGDAIAASGLPREELFVTTKVWNDDQGYDATLAAFDASVRQLRLDYVDLYLIHWPVPARDRYLDTWRALERLLAEERVRAIGVSNFRPAHLRRVIEESGTVPAVNQIELHPRLQQSELRAVHAEHGIATEAWSPLAQGGVLTAPAVTRLAERYGRTPAQIVLRWHLQLGNIVIPKSVTPERIRENIDILGFTLGEQDLAEIAALDDGTRIGPDPDTFG